VPVVWFLYLRPNVLARCLATLWLSRPVKPVLTYAIFFGTAPMILALRYGGA
jgi:hypothetical protein